MTKYNCSLAKLKTVALDYLRKAGLSGEQIQALETLGYFEAPASKRNHLAYPGGLVEHSLHVTDNLLALKAFENETSSYRVGMLHDLVKVFVYKKDTDGVCYEKQASCYPGHGVASVLHIEDLGVDLSNAEKQAIIWHMGGFAVTDRALNDAYDQAKLRFPREIVLTHAADHLAAAEEEADAAKEDDSNG